MCVLKHIERVRWYEDYFEKVLKIHSIFFNFFLKIVIGIVISNNYS